MPSRSKNHTKAILTLLVLSYFFLMCGNGLVSLTHPDEVFYTQTAREMLRHKSLATPYIFDEPQFEKPVFFYWLLAAAIQGFGDSPFAARFWPAFFGMLGVLVTYGLAWIMFGQRRLAFLAGLVLTSSLIYIILSRAVLTDMVFSTWVMLAIGSFYVGYTIPEHKKTAILLTGLFSGVAVLTKGVLGMCFPAGVILGFLVWKKDLRFLRCPEIFWGAVVFLVIAVPWHVLMYQRYGNWFLEEYFQNVHIRRLYDAEHQLSNTWYFYPLTMIVGVFPWSLFLFPALWMLARKLRGKDRDALGYLTFWVLGVWIFVQPAQSKLASYIFPVFPALAIIIAHFGSHVLKPAKHFAVKGFKTCSYALSSLCLVVAVGAVVFARIYIDLIIDIRPFYFFAFLLTAVGVMIMLLTRAERFPRALYSIAGIPVAFLTLCLLGRPYAEPWVSCKQISEIFKEIDQGDSVVLASKFYVRGVRYYTGRDMAVIDIVGKKFFSPHPIPFLNNDKRVLKLLGSQPVTYGIVKEAGLDDLRRIVKKGNFTLTNYKELGGKYIVKIE